MDIDRFIDSRSARWKRFEALLDEADAAPERELDHVRIQNLVRLYRQTCSDLNRARSLTANPELLGLLNGLTGRGYRFVYQASRFASLRESTSRFLLRDVPTTFRREKTAVLIAAASLVLGALFGFVAVLADSRNGERLVPAEFFSESPRARVERIESGEERVDSVGTAAAFGAFLMTHNIQVSFLAFSLGALTLIGGVCLLFYNGVLLGALAAMYVIDGVHVFFFAWVGPHGALEIPAIVFGGAAGLRAGRALLLPGDLTVGSSLREAFPSIWRMMVAVAVLLVMAGAIEGSFSQFTAASFPYPIKIGVASALFVSLVVFLFVRRPAPGGERR
jgi:uncharacterized membrane protein SpoIIM required for sporulation